MEKNTEKNAMPAKLLIICLVVVILLVLRIKFAQNTSDFVKRSEIMMDTYVTIKVQQCNGDLEAIEKAFQTFTKVEEMASFHAATSTLSLINKYSPVVVSASFSEIIEAAYQANSISEGYFDPTFSLIQRAYGFYSGVGAVPTDIELEKLKEKIGFSKMLKQVGENTYLLASGSLIDFGGIAGGYAVAQAAQTLRAASCSVFFVDDGGDIWVEGKKSNGQPWRIAVRDPRTNDSLGMFETFEPAAISTSGDYERFVEVDGKRYGHILNPTTGRPADYYRSVTVVATHPVLADIYSTTIFAMEPEKAEVWADEMKIPYLILTSSNEILINEEGKKVFKNVKTF